jgi:hypothetical protein
MRHPAFTCSVCTSPEPIRQIIDTELQKERGTRKTLRELAQMSGLSKSALSRHSVNCLLEARLAAHRDRRKKLGRIGRIVLKDSSVYPPTWTWRDPHDEHAEPQPFDPRTGFRPDDLFLELLPEVLHARVIAQAEQIRLARLAKEAAALVQPAEPLPDPEQPL